MKERIDPKAFDLIVSFESGKRPYYEKRLIHPTVPPGSSGVTIGFGYDLGYEKNLARDWSLYLSAKAIDALDRCVGKVKTKAQQALSGVRWISVPWDDATEVFNDRTLPQEIRLTLKTFPRSADLLPAPAFGALVSLIFNRGNDLEGPRRREMANIFNAMGNFDRTFDAKDTAALNKILKYLAGQFRSMKRLWEDDEDSDGDLVDRREAEAKLIESCIV